MSPSRYAQDAAEFIGTGILVASIVGSGIMGERLAGGNVALALLANSLATGAVLMSLIVTFSPVSGAHFNPLVTLTAASDAELAAASALRRTVVQILGGLTGVGIANAMFDLPTFFSSHHDRSGFSQILAEAVATFGLVLIARLSKSPYAVGGYIVGAYWFTSSTSFANPAVTIARTLTDTFSGIRPGDAPAFLAAQGVGGIVAAAFCRWIFLKEKTSYAR